jgi:hypothetical protein
LRITMSNVRRGAVADDYCMTIAPRINHGGEQHDVHEVACNETDDVDLGWSARSICIDMSGRGWSNKQVSTSTAYILGPLW